MRDELSVLSTGRDFWGRGGDRGLGEGRRHRQAEPLGSSDQVALLLSPSSLLSFREAVGVIERAWVVWLLAGAEDTCFCSFEPDGGGYLYLKDLTLSILFSTSTLH